MKKLEETQIQELIEKAISMMDHSYSPYSHFHVGAALLAKNGNVYGGCNIENAGYTPSNCAERTAFFKAVSEGVLEFDAICVVGGMNKVLKEYAAPCGVCRQAMLEYETLYGPIEVILYGRDRILRFNSVASLLPYCFTEF